MLNIVLFQVIYEISEVLTTGFKSFQKIFNLLEQLILVSYFCVLTLFVLAIVSELEGVLGSSPS